MRLLSVLRQNHHTISEMKNHCVKFNGIALAQSIKDDVKKSLLKQQEYDPKFKPQLVAVLVGNNPASKVYLKKKQEAARYCGLRSQIVECDNNINRSKLLGLINDLNQDNDVHGVIVQLPLPSHLSEIDICNAVHPNKDVDGFTQKNLGKLIQNSKDPSLVPCTALAVKRILSTVGCSTFGKRAVVIGRSHNVGLPISIILGADTNKGGFDMTVVSCHRATSPHNLVEVCQTADVIVSAVGAANLVNASMIKPGAVLIDVGQSKIRTPEGNKLVGDFNEDVMKTASVVTPVPGGVGPCTVACLMHNTLLAARLHTGSN